jgi:hypothetical protein
VKITNVKYHETLPVGVALIRADGRVEEASSYSSKRMLLKASILNRLIVTQPKNLILSPVVKMSEQKTVQNSGIRFPGVSVPSMLSIFES